MIQYDPRTGRARARLLANYNDLDVFVEDVATQNVYVRLVNRILGRRGRITSVIALGGRASVLSACRADQSPRGRPRLYIIDGDLDIVWGAPRPRLRYLYRLGVYCCENLVATEQAAGCIGEEALSSTTLGAVLQLLQIDSLVGDAARRLLPLFVLYGVAAKLGLGVATSSYPVHHLIDSPSGPLTLSSRRIRGRMRQLLSEIQSTGVAKTRYRAAKRRVRSIVTRSPDPASRYISGKTYLLPLVRLQLRKLAGVQETSQRLMVRMAQHCEIDVDPGLVRAVRRAIHSN
jgi:hypothetical protein